MLRDPPGRNRSFLSFGGPGVVGILWFDPSVSPAPFLFHEADGYDQFAQGTPPK
jgi:hypothetical protein